MNIRVFIKKILKKLLANVLFVIAIKVVINSVCTYFKPFNYLFFIIRSRLFVSEKRGRYIKHVNYEHHRTFGFTISIFQVKLLAIET